MPEQDKIAVMIPCLNEEKTIGKVIEDFRRELPAAEIYVFDNNSTDRTAQIAIDNGARVISEPRRGKGFVVEKMFGSIDADYYIMVDGDDTYSAAHVHELLAMVSSGHADMAIGARLSEYTDKSFRPLHVLGNNLVKMLINWIGGARLTDILSGYRVFNRKVVEKIPVVSKGFEIETEMTIQMLHFHMKIVEINVPYKERPQGSVSKLNTFSDGFRVLWKLFSLFCGYKPLTFFGIASMVTFILGLMVGILPIRDYMTDPNHYVSHVPSAILAACMVLLAFGFAFLGVLLHTINYRMKELHNILTRNNSYQHDLLTKKQQ
ncbi:MAG: glycosyltransferase [Sedimentisphaerales bacterium]|nr:glycosyltransferase [Sedimentisphaerales bacterium]MBN2841879.1 glycosyltransferase [Sedimentisphaerales bacterium]